MRTLEACSYGAIEFQGKLRWYDAQARYQR